MRLGALEASPGDVCQIKRANGDACLQSVQNPVVHPQTCAVGPARQRPHRSMVVGLHKLVTKACMYSDMERAVPALYRRDENGKIQEALLDVVIHPPA
eukprot:12341997-Karenia_brevis.AAC.1